VNARAQFGASLGVLAIGSGAAALISGRTWQTIRTPKEFGIDVLPLSGRDIDTAPLAFALVALAGVVAVLATQGWVRRVIGYLVAASGVLLAIRSATAISAVSASTARSLVRDKHKAGTFSDTVTPHVTTHPIWGALSIVCAVLVVVAGATIALRGGRWAAMSSRYETPAAAEARPVTDASLWTALDRGEDPTTSS
jgi:uncharacterized membrane protein (TIGR02234 family)